ncbi:MAG: hypothetical protein LBN07_02305 [Christensenellaceae bacterium]|jgi:CBS domain containing-hemolysin-like protein|nr:hypothetical protein [Christensenellaceae bacterium]
MDGIKKFPKKAKPRKRVHILFVGRRKYKWIIKITILTLCLALFAGIISEMILSRTNMVFAVIILLIFLFVNIVFDMIGLAFAACPQDKLIDLRNQNVSGSSVALRLSGISEKVSSFCSDVVGDICGILSGAAGSAIAIKIIIRSDSLEVLLAAGISATVAGLTVFGKALCKRLAIYKSLSVVLFVGRFISMFKRERGR